MPGMAALAMGVAPVLGGALLGAAVGQFKGPDLRDGIKQDLELLEQLPESEAGRREALRRSINDRIDDLIAANDAARRPDNVGIFAHPRPMPVPEWRRSQPHANGAVPAVAPAVGMTPEVPTPQPELPRAEGHEPRPF